MSTKVKDMDDDGSSDDSFFQMMAQKGYRTHPGSRALTAPGISELVDNDDSADLRRALQNSLATFQVEEDRRRSSLSTSEPEFSARLSTDAESNNDDDDDELIVLPPSSIKPPLAIENKCLNISQGLLDTSSRRVPPVLSSSGSRRSDPLEVDSSPSADEGDRPVEELRAAPSCERTSAVVGVDDNSALDRKPSSVSVGPQVSRPDQKASKATNLRKKAAAVVAAPPSTAVATLLTLVLSSSSDDEEVANDRIQKARSKCISVAHPTRSVTSLTIHPSDHESVDSDSPAIKSVISKNGSLVGSNAGRSITLRSKKSAIDQEAEKKALKEQRQQLKQQEKLAKEEAKRQAKAQRERERQGKLEAAAAEKLRQKRRREEAAQVTGKHCKKEVAVLMEPSIFRHEVFRVVDQLQDAGYTAHEYPSGLGCQALQWIRNDFLQGGAIDGIKSLMAGNQQGYQHIPVVAILFDVPHDFIALLERSNHEEDDNYPKLEQWLRGVEVGWKAAWKSSVHPRPRIILILYQVNEALDRLWVSYRKNSRKYERAPPTAEELHDAITWLLIQFQVECEICATEEEISHHLVKMTRLLAEEPYQKQITELQCVKKLRPQCSDMDAPRERAKDCWIRCLQQIPRLSQTLATNLAEHYPTAKSLWRAYESDEITDDEKHVLLADLLSNRSRQVKLSYHVYRVMTSRDPDEVLR